MQYQEKANLILKQFLARLNLREQKEFLLLTKQWGIISDNLDVLILKLAEKDIKTEDQLYRLALYQEFKEQAKAQIETYSKIASGVVSDNQKIFGKAGIDSTQQMIGLKVKFFQKLPVDTINNFIGKSFYDGSLLDQTLFSKSYPDYMEKVKNTLLNSIALGRNPRETARLIKKDSTAPLWESLRLARTEQLSIYRETSRMQMERSGVCSGWQRIEQDDACDFCKERNGKIYRLDETFESHPSCRGASIPYFEV